MTGDDEIIAAFEESLKNVGEQVRVTLEIGPAVYGVSFALPPGFPERFAEPRIGIALQAGEIAREVAVAFARHFKDELEAQEEP